MSGFNPSQVAFNAGEWSPQMAARVDLEARSKAVKRCENFKLRPQGPALMRAGSIYAQTWTEAEEPRLFTFRVRGGTEDYVVAVGSSKVRIFSKSGLLLTFNTNLIVDGGVDTDWTLKAGTPWSGTATWSAGTIFLATGGKYLQQTITTIAGATYRLSFRNKSGGTDVTIGAATTTMHYESGAWHYRYIDFVAAGTSTLIKFTYYSISGYIDDVVVYRTDGGEVTEFASPWSAGQLATLQASSELSNGRTYFVHGEVRPYTLYMPAPGAMIFEFYAPCFTGVDETINQIGWSGSNWPGVVEAGFQGRLWFAASPDQPSTLWGSRSGLPFNFDLGTGLANEAIAQNVTLKGQIEWVQGQRIMLLGSETAEHAVSSASGLIKTSDFNVEDASGFGSAPVQAKHIGDQVIFVTSDRRKVRALDYSWEKQAWFSRAVTWASEEIIDSDIIELHFSRTPDPVIVAVLASGELRACTYDRTENIMAWWRIVTGGLVKSAAMARTDDGDELWLSADRNGQHLLERIPLHEVGCQYLDAHVLAMVQGGGLIPSSALDHLPGTEVGIVVEGVIYPNQVVPAYYPYSLHLDPGLAGHMCVIGVPYTATLKQLPLEGGLQAGSSQSAKRRRTKVRLRLNNSALPLVNGRRAAERAPADPMDTGTDLVTGDVDCNVLGWEEDGALTIEQDLPFRTEVLAIFGNAQANEV